MLRKLLLFLIFNALSVCLHLQAQQSYVISLEKQIAMPSNAIYNLMQDSKGFIWMSGKTGLVKYDATQFYTYRCEAQTSQAGSCIQEDKFGRIWYENFDGYLYYIENEKLNTLNQNNVLNYFPYGLLNNHLITLHKNGLDVYDLKTLEHHKTINFNSNQNISTSSYNNSFYIITENEMMCVNGNLEINKSYFFNKSNNKLKHIYASQDYVFVVEIGNEDQNLFVFDKNLNFLRTYPIIGQKVVNDIILIDNDLWLCTANGASVYDFRNDKAKPKTILDGISISMVMRDRYKNLWLSSTNKGVYIMPQNNLEFYTLPFSGSNKFIETNEGFYIGTQQGSLYNFNYQQQQVKKLFQTDNQAEIYYIAQDLSKENIYFSANGFIQLNPKNFKSEKNDLAIKKIVSLDSQFFAFASSGLVALYKSDFKTKNQNSFWTNYFNLHKTTVQDNEFAEIDGSIRAKTIAYDINEKTIYYSGNKGFFSINAKTFSKNEIMFSGNSFYATEILIGQNFKYLLSTKGSLYKVNSKNQFTLINNLFKADKDGITYFKESNGYGVIIADQNVFLLNLITDEIKPLVLPVLTIDIKDILIKDNHLFLLLEDGILKVNTILDTQTQIKYPFLINEIKVNNNPIRFKNNLDLKYFENNIAISCSYLNYIYSNQHSIYYKLNNGSWQLLNSKIKMVQFASLAWGKYELKFKIDDSIQEQVFRFSIKKPFWYSWWFIGLIVLAILFLIYAYNRWRASVYGKQIMLLNEKVALEQSLGNSILTSIKSQMNPHFFYNALNTIQAYIFTNDKKKASAYLAKFSKLTRMILEMSEMEKITIQKEIEALTLYLELEKMRFEDEFHFTISVQSSVEFEMIKIPSMLIQPYVENAVKHGLMHSKGEKRIEINFNRINNDLTVEIIDNGIGMKNAEEIKAKSEIKHQSFSSSANQKRLDILNQNRTNKLSVSFSSLNIENQEQPGTVVTLIIPIN